MRGGPDASERAGGLSLRWLPAPVPLGRAQPQSRSSWAAGAAVLGGAVGRAGVSGITGDGFVPGHLGPRQRPQPRVAAAPLEAGRLVHVPGGLRCEDYVTFLPLASNGPLSLQLLQ